MDLALLLIVVPALIALNGLFVAAEYALVRSRLDRIDQLAEEGARGAPLARRQIEHIDQYIAACQVGITLASIGIGAIGEPVVAHYLDKPLGGPLSHGAATVIAAIVAYMLISAAHITFGELIAEDLHGRAARGRGPPALTAPRVLEHRLQAGGDAALRRRPPARSPLRHQDRGARRGDHNLGGPQVPHRPQRLRRQARPGRGGDAVAASSTCTSSRRAT